MTYNVFSGTLNPTQLNSASYVVTACKWASYVVLSLLQVYAVDWSPDGQRVASGGKDKVLKMWANSYVAASAAAATELFNSIRCTVPHCYSRTGRTATNWSWLLGEFLQTECPCNKGMNLQQVKVEFFGDRL